MTKWPNPQMLLVWILFQAWVPSVFAEGGRIISLAPSVTETLFALGAGDRVVGVSLYCDYPAAVRQIAKVGTFLTPNIELIVATKPDVVIAVPSPGNRAPVETLERLGIKVVVIDPETISEIEESFVTIGKAIGMEAAGRRLVLDTQARLRQLSQQLADAPLRRVLMVVGQTPLVAVGQGIFPDELLSLARGQNVARDVGGAWPRLSIEAALASAPEVIIDTTMGSEESVSAQELVSFWQAYPSLPAVRNGRVYGYRSYALLRPGPRITEALETLARFVHPERFANPGAGDAQRAESE